MRKGSKFTGTEQELDNYIRKYLPKYVTEISWINKIIEQVSEQEYINICESIAESVYRGYIDDKTSKVVVHDLANGRISITHLDLSNDDKPHPPRLSEYGINFLNQNNLTYK